MGALVGLGVGVGLLLVWSAFFVPRTPRAPRDRPGRIAAPPRRGRAGRRVRPGRGAALPRAGCRGRAGGPGRLGDAAGGAGLRRDGGVPPGRGGRRPGATPAARVRGGVARGGRQPRLGGPRGHVAARRARRPRPSRARAAAAGVRRVRPRLPGDAAASASASTGSRTGWPTRSATASSRVCGSPARSAAASSAGCCATCPATCATTPAPAPSWSRDRPGPSTAPGWRSPRRGSCCCSCRFQSEVIHRYASPRGRGGPGGRRRALRGRLPADDADRPAARRAADPAREPGAVGCRARRGGRGPGCCSWSRACS